MDQARVPSCRIQADRQHRCLRKWDPRVQAHNLKQKSIDSPGSEGKTIRSRKNTNSGHAQKPSPRGTPRQNTQVKKNNEKPTQSADAALRTSDS